MAGGEPTKPFEKLSQQVDAIIDEMFGKHYARFCPVNPWQPDVNLYENDKAYIVCVDLGGMTEQDFDVSVQSGVLLIRGERARPLPATSPSETKVHLMEINTGGFSREVEIPSRVQHERISAEYRDGLLWITLPKT